MQYGNRTSPTRDGACARAYERYRCIPDPRRASRNSIHQSDHEHAHPQEQRCQLQVRPEIKRARSGLIHNGREARAQRESDESQADPPIRQGTASLSPHSTDARDHEETGTGEAGPQKYGNIAHLPSFRRVD